MSKQRPNADKLANELMGASAFFRQSPAPAKDEPSQPEVEQPHSPAKTEEPSTPESQPRHDVVTSRRQHVTTSSPEVTGFDINRPTASRDSLRLSIDETRALDELRQALKWDYDLTVTKNDICRVALHQLLEDWSAKGERSSAISRLKRKQTSR
jgi:hypothetical protein